MASIGRVVFLILFASLWSYGIGGSAGAQVIGTVAGLSGPACLQPSGVATTVPLVLRNELHEGDTLHGSGSPP